MAEDTASLVQFYAREGAGAAITVEKRVAAGWHAACPGQEVLHGVQYVGTMADPTAFGNTMAAKLQAMDAAAHSYAGELSKEHPDDAVLKTLRTEQANEGREGGTFAAKIDGLGGAGSERIFPRPGGEPLGGSAPPAGK